MRTMVKKYSKSMYAKIELDKLVHMMVVNCVPTRRYSNIDMMGWVKKINQEDHSTLNFCAPHYFPYLPVPLSLSSMSLGASCWKAGGMCSLRPLMS